MVRIDEYLDVVCRFYIYVNEEITRQFVQQLIYPGSYSDNLIFIVHNRPSMPRSGVLKEEGNGSVPFFQSLPLQM
jgi:hypothetical protein